MPGSNLPPWLSISTSAVMVRVTGLRAEATRVMMNRLLQDRAQVLRAVAADQPCDDAEEPGE